MKTALFHPNQQRHRVDQPGSCASSADAVSIATFQTSLYCLPQQWKDAGAGETRPENHHVVGASMLFDLTVNLITLFTAECSTCRPISSLTQNMIRSEGPNWLQPAIILIICDFRLKICWNEQQVSKLRFRKLDFFQAENFRRIQYKKAQKSSLIVHKL